MTEKKKKKKKIKEATGYFREDPERNVYYLFNVLDALRLYGLGEETYQLSREAYQKLKYGFHSLFACQKVI